MLLSLISKKPLVSLQCLCLVCSLLGWKKVLSCVLEKEAFYLVAKQAPLITKQLSLCEYK